MLTKTQKNEKGPLSHRKINGSFLDYVQLLILAKWSEQKMLTKMQKNEKGPLSLKNKMFIFGLCLHSDDRLSDPGKKCWLKCKKTKRPPKSLKNKMFFFLIMFNFWWLAEQSGQKMLTETQKNEKGPLSHWKIKCSFLDYVQLLIIGQAIRAKNVDRKAKKWKRPPRSLKNKMFIFGLCSTSDDRPSDLSKKCWPKGKKMKKAP